jgi:DNA-binding transcriptional LysR family regulator
MINNFYYKKDRLNQLRGFCAFVQEGTIVKAGKKIGIENSTISKQIKALERDLKINLFIKNKIRDRLVLSENGRKLYERAVLIVQSMDGLYRDFANDIDYEEKNTLRIAGVNFVLLNILPQYMKVLVNEEQFLNLNIEIFILDKKEALEKLKKREIDIAIYPSLDIGKENYPEIKSIVFRRAKPILVFDKNHPLSKIKNPTKTEIEKYPYVFLNNYKYQCDNFYEMFNFKKSKISFNEPNFNIIMEYIKDSQNIMIMQEEFYNKYKTNNKEFFGIDISEYTGIGLISYFILNDVKQKDGVSYLAKLLRD